MTRSHALLFRSGTASLLTPPSRAHLFHVGHCQPLARCVCATPCFTWKGRNYPGTRVGSITELEEGSPPSPRVLASLGMTLALSLCQIEMFHVEQWRAVATWRRGGAP